MSTVPALPPPSTPSSANPYGGAGPLLLGVTWAEACIATPILALRIYAALRLIERPGWDLCWACVTYLIAIPAQVLLCLGVTHGLGNHATEVSGANFVQSLKWAWIGQYLTIVGIAFGKIAVVALLLGIEKRTNKRKTWLLHFIWSSNMLFSIAQIALLNLQCTPAKKLWDVSAPGVCVGRARALTTGLIQGSWSAASDLALAIYPIYMFWELNVSRRKKISLCLLMGGGFVTVISSIIKTIYIKLAPEHADVTHSLYPLVMGTYTEMWLILILGCVPQLRILYKKVYEKASVVVTRSRRDSQRDSVSFAAEKHGSMSVARNERSSIPQYQGSNCSHESDDEISPPRDGGGIHVRQDYLVEFTNKPKEEV